MWIFVLIIALGFSNDCENQLQSPIDIVSPFTYLDPKIEYYLGYQENAILYHDGYNLRIDGDFGGFLWGTSFYWSTEIIFKQPSEHTLQGTVMPMEMQIFFRDQFDNLAAMSALFSNSTDSNFLNEIGFGNPQLHDSGEGSLFKISNPVDIGSLIGYPETYLYYQGSTTISPCESNVTWIMLTDTYKVSPQQLSNFPSNLYNVIRSVQPLNGRPIYCNFDKSKPKTSTNNSNMGDDTLINTISSGQSYKKVNDNFIIESESYLNDFPTVTSIYSN